jgi:hypothetical protein
MWMRVKVISEDMQSRLNLLPNKVYEAETKYEEKGFTKRIICYFTNEEGRVVGCTFPVEHQGMKLKSSMLELLDD